MTAHYKSAKIIKVANQIHNLRIPGPTTLLPQASEKMGGPAFNHRGPIFEKLIVEVTKKLQEVFHTTSDVLILTASGTGGLEAAIVNTLSPGDKILTISIGTFGNRFSQIASAYGANVVKLEYPWGEAADPAEIKSTLDKNPDIIAVLLTHNETSTGAMNDLQTIAKIVKEKDCLLLVDGVSSVAAIPLRTDDWGCDVVITASQKGFGVPPGLAMISMSRKSWEYYEKAKMPKFYWDLGKARGSLENSQTPFTPATHQIDALNAGLDVMLKETLDTLIERHNKATKIIRQGVRDLGFELLTDDSCASTVVTSVKAPNVKEIVSGMRAKGIEIAGGYGKLEGKIFRIGHLGFFTMEEIEETLTALKEVIK